MLARSSAFDLLLCPIGSAGDVYPFMGLGLALQARGHRVTLITSGYFAETATRIGLDLVDIASKDLFLELVSDPNLWHPARGLQTIFEKCVHPLLIAQYEAIVGLQTPRTIIVTSCLGFAARVVQDQFGVPTITAHLQPGVIWSDIAPPALYGISRSRLMPRWLRRAQLRMGQRWVLDRIGLPPVNALRQQLGLKPVKNLMTWWESPDCILAMFPSWYATPQADWPPQLQCTQFPLWDEPLPASESLTPSCRDFLDAGDAPIVFTGGSANMFAQQLFAAAVDACRQLEKRGILVSQFPETVPPELPDNIMHVKYQPFSALLPRIAALVHHGGVGTTARAFATATPQLITPLAHDQTDNAIRVTALGVGDWVPTRRIRAVAIAEKLANLLASHEVSDACGSVARRIATVDPFAASCEVIENYARTAVCGET